jgi:hypothetical protein
VIVLDSWDVVALVGLLLVLIGAAAIYWPLALILGGGLLLGAYYVRECRHAAESPDPVAVEPDRDESE